MRNKELIFIEKYNGQDNLIITENGTTLIIKKPMKLKNKNVRIKNLCKEINYCLENIEKAIQKLEGKDYSMTITSGNDGQHMKNSLHYEDKAIDVRSRDMNYPVGNCLNIRKALGKNYDVILERDHIHIEYQPKK